MAKKTICLKGFHFISKPLGFPYKLCGFSQCKIPSFRLQYLRLECEGRKILEVTPKFPAREKA